MTGCPITERKLSQLENFAEGAPYELMATLRRNQSVSWEEGTEEREGHWNVLRQSEVDEVLKNPIVFSSAGGPRIENPPPELITGDNQSINLMDPPRHRSYRSLIDGPFKPAAIAEREPTIRAVAKEVIDEVIDLGACEFIDSVAQQLPLRVICKILGVPDEDRKYLCETANVMMLGEDPDFATGLEDGYDAHRKLIEYGTKLAVDHRANPRDSVTMEILEAGIDGGAISDHEYALLFINLVIGGIETTRNSTSFGLEEMIRDPELFKNLQADPSLIPDAMQENLRRRGPINYLRRNATEDYELGGQQIRKGDKVVVWLVSVNRDENSFDDPDTFDVSRCQREPVRRNMRTFGLGTHFCIGQHLAIMQLKVIFEEITSRMFNIKLVDEPKIMLSPFVHGIKEMNITFDSLK